jgi:hypothetical protein
MDLMILKKKIDGFRLPNGQIQAVPPELLLELRHSWENFSGPISLFRKELGMRIGTLRKLLIDSKKLNHVLSSAELIGLQGPESDSGQKEGNSEKSCQIELVYDQGNKIIRFPSIDSLVEFLRKAA